MKRENSDKLAKTALTVHLNLAQVAGVAAFLTDLGIPVYKDPRTIMKTPTAKLEDQSFYHFGLKEELQQRMRHGVDEHVLEILIQVHVDGVPIFNSSRSQFWPILCRIINVHNKKPFCVSCYYGTTKSEDYSIYMTPFIDEYNQLALGGLQFESKSYTVKLESFIMDRPARSSLKDIVAHNAYHGCERCTCVGQRIGYFSLTNRQVSSPPH